MRWNIIWAQKSLEPLRRRQESSACPEADSSLTWPPGPRGFFNSATNEPRHHRRRRVLLLRLIREFVIATAARKELFEPTHDALLFASQCLHGVDAGSADGGARGGYYCSATPAS
jgi:hypothetical protein